MTNDYDEIMKQNDWIVTIKFRVEESNLVYSSLMYDLTVGITVHIVVYGMN